MVFIDILKRKYWQKHILTFIFIASLRKYSYNEPWKSFVPLFVTSWNTPPPAESNSGNSVAAFLNHAERQAETDEQRREIQRALRDMLEKSPAELRRMRYADYTGEADKWSISQMLQHYFVPNPPAALDEQRLFQEVRAPAARAASCWKGCLVRSLTIRSISHASRFGCPARWPQPLRWTSGPQ